MEKTNFHSLMVPHYLYQRGLERITKFCQANKLEVPSVTLVTRKDWQFDPCAYWRPDTELQRKWGHTGIQICVEKCARIARQEEYRNWNWPGTTVDRTAYGVLAHEIGHLMDWSTGEKKGAYFSEYCEEVMGQSGEAPLTSYCPNPAEWLAEMCRLFITNADLLRRVRPITFNILCLKWQPVSSENWLDEVGQIPERIRVAQERKMV